MSCDRGSDRLVFGRRIGLPDPENVARYRSDEEQENENSFFLGPGRVERETPPIGAGYQNLPEKCHEEIADETYGEPVDLESPEERIPQSIFLFRGALQNLAGNCQHPQDEQEPQGNRERYPEGILKNESEH